MVKDVIRQHREKLGVSQGKLAKDLDIPLPTIQNYEYGRRFPSLHNALLLSDYLHCDIRDLDRWKA